MALAAMPTRRRLRPDAQTTLLRAEQPSPSGTRRGGSAARFQRAHNLAVLERSEPTTSELAVTQGALKSYRRARAYQLFS